MNKLSTAKRSQIIHCLVEGNSIRATCRMTGASKNTVTKLLCEIGAACSDFQDKAFRNLPCKRIQCDEIWSFVGAKEKNASREEKGKGRIGDVWTWTALCPDTKLVPCWFVGTREGASAYHFMSDLAERLASRVQLTTDGHRAYLEAVDSAFGTEIDYAMLVKIYGKSPGGEGRYSPAQCIGARRTVISGKPEHKHISTSLMERQNLTMRMGMRRFTRLTNAFSKKLENHEHAIALHFMYYNFARIHQSLRVTPAMAAGISDHVWSIEEIVGLIENSN
ncbi:MAG: IS1 family transposase [Bdellovibrionaceae bacterium]|nr:IS1 family transposase [Pseudobdellovibrionaceae bacterium]